MAYHGSKVRQSHLKGRLIQRVRNTLKSTNVTVKVSYTTTVSANQEWMVEKGTRLHAGASIEVGSPFTSAKGSLHIDATTELKWGNIKSNVETKEKTMNAEVTVRPKETVRLTWRLMEGTVVRRSF